ncbi:MAG: type II toxin-antitoxin system RelB/DinJ family antitoxin [Planctomycetes bacterium]|nr:type II toxin-antitoxin system RelB/DinJ family antitoxin [Planctomycetota bacterium]
MANDALLHVRIDTKTKNRAAKFFKRYGLSTSDGVRLLIAQALRAQELPHVPNAETRKALRDENLQEITPDDLTTMIMGDT